MGKVMNLTGQRFGDLVVLKIVGKTKHRNYRWLCQCDCGNVTVSSAGNLKTRHVLSCGCRRTPHGFFGTRLYSIWAGMKSRCCNPKSPNYKDYGGRGISICKEWLEFIPFKVWALSNGYEKEITIDRIENDGNYEPNNCRWVSTTINNQNRRNTRLSAKKVILIRFLLERSRLEQKQIGSFFGVNQNVISQVKNKKLWGNIARNDWVPIKE